MKSSVSEILMARFNFINDFLWKIIWIPSLAFWAEKDTKHWRGVDWRYISYYFLSTQRHFSSTTKYPLDQTKTIKNNFCIAEGTFLIWRSKNTQSIRLVHGLHRKRVFVKLGARTQHHLRCRSLDRLKKSCIHSSECIWFLYPYKSVVQARMLWKNVLFPSGHRYIVRCK